MLRRLLFLVVAIAAAAVVGVSWLGLAQALAARQADVAHLPCPLHGVREPATEEDDHSPSKARFTSKLKSGSTRLEM